MMMRRGDVGYWHQEKYIIPNNFEQRSPREHCDTIIDVVPELIQACNPSLQQSVSQSAVSQYERNNRLDSPENADQKLLVEI